MQSLNLLEGLTPADVKKMPCPFVNIANRLDGDVFARLAAEFPDIVSLTQGVEDYGERKFALYASDLLPMGKLSPLWREFAEAHISQAFFRQVAALFKDDIAQYYPDLEDRVGKPFNDFTIGWNDRRNKNEQMVANRPDIIMDVGFSHDYTHVQRSARGAHTDHNAKLFAGLLYFRFPEDNTTGGELELCAPKPGRKVFTKDGDVIWHKDYRSIDDTAVYTAASIPFQPNQFVMFLNTARSIHRVSLREPSQIPRRHIYISGRVIAATAQNPLFRVVPPKQNIFVRVARGVKRRLGAVRQPAAASR
jgi:hypothetical protein